MGESEPDAQDLLDKLMGGDDEEEEAEAAPEKEQATPEAKEDI